MDKISVEAHDKRKAEDNFEIFGKSVAFQLQAIEIRK
jgi:hypothetical protein